MLEERAVGVTLYSRQERARHRRAAQLHADSIPVHMV